MIEEKVAIQWTGQEIWPVKIIIKRRFQKMCDLEKQKLREHGQALPEEQKRIVIQEFPMRILLDEIARRDRVNNQKIAGCEQSLQYE